jgi:hypothetical protein
MNKIIKALLEAKFPTLNVEDLLEVINATANPTIATEVLCGLYDAPSVNDFAENTNSEINRVFVSYNKYNNKVTYAYNKRKHKTVDVLKARTEEPTFETPSLSGYYISDKAKSLNISEELFKTLYEEVIVFDKIEKDTRTSECSLESWKSASM